MLRSLSRRWCYAWLAACFLAVACAHHPQLTSVQTGTIELNASADSGADTSILRTIAPYKSGLDKEMNEVLIVSESAFSKGEPEGELGDLVADIILEEAAKKYAAKDNIPLQFCVLNNGGLRVPLPKGEITRGKAFELMPFENEMVVLTLTGQQTKQLFDFIAAKNGMPVSGIKMGIKNSTAVNVLVNGVPFDPARNYTLVTSDYLANGGDKMDFFKSAARTVPLGYKLRDAIIDNFKELHQQGKTLKAKTDGRIYYDK
jgi:2',3'-cyclic-nucleotide 2'-phosphodiesterase (5'-nucleotidase family)